MLSDFFVANPDEALALDAESSPLEHFPGFNCRGVEIVKILTLLSLIDGSDVMKNIDKIDSYFLRQGDESWTVEIPQAIVDHLASADGSQIATLARDWTNTDEWKLDEGREEDVRWILVEMAKLSTLATTNNRNLYLWISL